MDDARARSEGFEKLRTFINSLPTDEQHEFAESCETSVAYLRKAISTGEPLREKLVIALERESGAAVLLEELRPDVDWAYVRGSTAAPSRKARRAYVR